MLACADHASMMHACSLSNAIHSLYSLRVADCRGRPISEYVLSCLHPDVTTRIALNQTSLSQVVHCSLAHKACCTMRGSQTPDVVVCVHLSTSWFGFVILRVAPQHGKQSCQSKTKHDSFCLVHWLPTIFASMHSSIMPSPVSYKIFHMLRHDALNIKCITSSYKRSCSIRAATH